LYEQPNACLENHDFVRKNPLDGCRKYFSYQCNPTNKKGQKNIKDLVLSKLLLQVIAVNSRNKNKEVHNSMYKENKMFI